MKTEKCIYTQAQKLGACPMLTGKEDINGLIDLFFTPQGIEFCTKHSFPDMGVLRQLKERYNLNKEVFIDTELKMKNPSRVALFGSGTIAELEYDGSAERYEVVVMHGATAKIKASGYAVVIINNTGGVVETCVNDNALIL